MPRSANRMADRRSCPPPFEAAAADGSTASGTIADGTASGSVTLADGATITLALPATALRAGLYQRFALQDGEPTQARTIVLADGTAKGAQKKYDCGAGKATFTELLSFWDEATTSVEKEGWKNQALEVRAEGRAAGSDTSSWGL